MNRIKAMRLMRGYSISELALRADMTETRIKDFENETHIPTKTDYAVLGAALGIDGSYLAHTESINYLASIQITHILNEQGLKLAQRYKSVEVVVPSSYEFYNLIGIQYKRNDIELKNVKKNNILLITQQFNITDGTYLIKQDQQLLEATYYEGTMYRHGKEIKEYEPVYKIVATSPCIDDIIIDVIDLIRKGKILWR